MNALEWLGAFAVDNFIKCHEWKETIPTLMIVGAVQFGTNKKAKAKIKKWMSQESTGIDITRSPHEKYFDKCWGRLEENGAFKRGGVDAFDDEETVLVELGLLIGVARSYKKRGPKPRVV